MLHSHTVYRFSEVDREDVFQVGTKGGMLGEFVHAGFPIPEGFIISSSAYFTFLKDNNLITKINHLLQTVNFQDPHSILQVSSHIQKMIKQGDLNDTMVEDIFRSYRFLGGTLKDPTVIVRSDITSSLPSIQLIAEPHPFLTVTGESSLVVTIKSLWASLFEPKLLYHRHEKQYDAFKIGMAVIVQNVINTDISGSLFSMDPLKHDKNSYIIEALYGIKESSTASQIPVDTYRADKKTGEIVETVVREQPVAREQVGNDIHTVRLSPEKQHKRKLTSEQLQQIISLGRRIEEQHYFPYECGWGIKNNNLYLLSLKPLTPHPTQSQIVSVESTPEITAPKQGTSHTQGIATGHARVIQTQTDISHIVSGEIVILEALTEQILLQLKRTYGIVIEQPLTSPVLIQSAKELGLPMISGITNARTHYKNGSVITLNANSGEITPGGLLLTESHKKVRQQNAQPTTTATKLYLEIKKPMDIEEIALLKSDGVGLLHGEHYLLRQGTHPKKLTHDGNHTHHSNELATALESLCRNFYPRPVIYKASDLQSSDYRKLRGGTTYEPAEQNPIIGYRGGYRLMHDPESFNLELHALQTVRTKMDMTNLQLLLPFIRSPQELKRIKKHIWTQSFSHSPSFKLWLSIDTPENVIRVDSYIAEGIQGIVLNVTSLATLFTGIDPTNSEVAAAFTEENDAVLQAIQFVTKRAHKHALPIILTASSITHAPELVEKAVSWGVSGIITPPAGLENLRKTLYKYERKLIR